jgi:hypothetical protein
VEEIHFSTRASQILNLGVRLQPQHVDFLKCSHPVHRQVHRKRKDLVILKDNQANSLGNFGGAGGNRTHDLLNAMHEGVRVRLEIL